MNDSASPNDVPPPDARGDPTTNPADFALRGKSDPVLTAEKTELALRLPNEKVAYSLLKMFAVDQDFNILIGVERAVDEFHQLG